MTKMMERLEEFDRRGVPNIWVIDPRLRTIAVYSSGVLNEVRGDRAATTGDPCLELTRDEIFKDLQDVELAGPDSPAATPASPPDTPFE